MFTTFILPFFLILSFSLSLIFSLSLFFEINILSSCGAVETALIFLWIISWLFLLSLVGFNSTFSRLFRMIAAEFSGINFLFSEVGLNALFREFVVWFLIFRFFELKLKFPNEFFFFEPMFELPKIMLLFPTFEFVEFDAKLLFTVIFVAEPYKIFWLFELGLLLILILLWLWKLLFAKLFILLELYVILFASLKKFIKLFILIIFVSEQELTLL